MTVLPSSNRDYYLHLFAFLRPYVYPYQWRDNYSIPKSAFIQFDHITCDFPQATYLPIFTETATHPDCLLKSHWSNFFLCILYTYLHSVYNDRPTYPIRGMKENLSDAPKRARECPLELLYPKEKIFA